MVKTRTTKKPNKLFETDYVGIEIPKKVGKKKKPRKPTRQLSPRRKSTIPLASPDPSPERSVSPPRKRTRQKIKQEPPETSGKGLTIVFARKGRDVSISGKKGKSRKSSKKSRRIEEDLRSTSASFKRKGMDRESRPDSPTRGIDEIDRIKFAIEEVRSGEVTSVQKAAFKWRIHADKLYRRLKGTVRIDGRNGPPPVLSRAEEDKLTTWINTMSERGFPVSSGSLRNTVQNFLKQDKRDNPFTDDKPSMSWYKAFVRRNPKVKTVSSMMMTRSHKYTESVLKGWYGELDTFLRCLDIIDRPEKIWHFVAIDLSTSSSHSASSNGTVDIASVVRDKVCTCIVSGNAAGHVIPPFFVFRGHCVPSTWDPLVGSPLSSGQLFTQMGSASKTMYSDWLENHFLPNVGPERPVALLLDCPEGHIDVDVFVTAQQNDVHMFRILPSIADIVCPIPEDMLRVAWDREAAMWNKSHPLVPVSAKNAARIVGKAWPQLDQPEVIIRNFRKVGIYPVSKDVIEDLLLDKLRKERELEEANRIAALRPAQSIISLELFESRLEKDRKEQFHRQLLAKESGEETDEFREWKQLYEEVYGKIIPVQDVPVAEEEVTVSYVEHVVDQSEIIETEVTHDGEMVTVEVKDEFDPSEVVFSGDLSSVPRDVINVALTMATDIATYRTETANPVGTSIPVTGTENTVVVTSSELPTAGGLDTLTTAQVHDGGEVATTVEIVSASEVGQSQQYPVACNSFPSTFDTTVTSTSAPGFNQKTTIVNVVPVSKNTRQPTVVNVIRVTPGEKRDVSQSNIAVHQTPVSLSKSTPASGVLEQLTMAGAEKHTSNDGREEILPLIHISDTGEVSVVPAKDAKEEIVEVTDVVEVDGPVYHDISAEQVMQQIQVTEVSQGDNKPPIEDVTVTTGTVEQPQGHQEGQQQEHAPAEAARENEANNSASEAAVPADEPEHFTYKVTLTSEDGSQAKEVSPENIQITTIPQALSSNIDVASGQDSSTPEAISVSEVDQVPIEMGESTVVEVIEGAVVIDDPKQGTIIAESSESAGFDGPGNVPLMQGDVVVEEINESAEGSVPDPPADIVIEGDSVTQAENQPKPDEAMTVEVSQETVVGQDEMGEILAPSEEETNVTESNVSQNASSET